jgi:hypothetical protein
MYSEGGPEMGKDVARMHSVVNEIFGFVRGPAQEMEIGEVERSVLRMVMEVGREALIEFVAAKGTGYSGQEVPDSEGAPLPYVRERERAYRSVFGKIEIKRAYYQAKGKDGVFPLDGMLNLPDGGYSYLVQEIASKLVMNASYEKACEVFSDIFPMDVPIRSLEQVVGKTCEDAARYYEAKSPPEPPDRAVVTVATLDKKGVVMRKPPSEDTDVSKDPKKQGKKKMSTVISAYSIERHIRSADDVAGEFNEEKAAPSKPKPQCKQVWGSLTEGPEKTVAFLAERVRERFRTGNELVCILDGEPSLWRLVYKYFPTAFFVLDIFHVLEHIADVAHCFYKEKSPEAKAFVRQRLRMLLTGNAGRLIGGLKQILTKRKLTNSQKYRIGQAIGYLERNKRHMRYDLCLEKGYPIGSGVIEGACRNLINDRLELTGMRWTFPGAESMIRLRAVYINSDWKDFWSFRRKSQRNRLYGIAADDRHTAYALELAKAAA